MFTSLAHVVPLFQGAFFAHLRFLYQPTFSYPSLRFHLFPPPPPPTSQLSGCVQVYAYLFLFPPPPPFLPSFLVVYQSIFTYFSAPSFLVVYQSLFTYFLSPPPPPQHHQLFGCVPFYLHLHLHQTSTSFFTSFCTTPRPSDPPPPPHTHTHLSLPFVPLCVLITDKARLIIILRTPKAKTV